MENPYELVGQILNNYRIDELIGIGGMGAVYKAYDTGVHRQVAFKILRPDLAKKDQSLVGLFAEEAQKAASLNHPSIITVYGYGRINGDLAYIVMEWLEGQTLEEVLRSEGHFSFEQANIVIQQIAAALEAAHAVLIHRDLKPSNVMLVRQQDGGEHVKVLDFGIAKVIGSPVSRVMGTEGYASPEQLKIGGNIDKRSDIYSLGMMLYAMLTGDLQINAPLPPLSLRRPDAPPQVEQLINSMLEKEPAKRPQSAAEVARLFALAIHTVELKGRVEWTLRDSQKTAPILGANVRMVNSQQSQVTDEDGFFAFGQVRDSESPFKVIVQAEHFEPTQLELRSQETTVINLKPLTIVQTGKVLTKAHNKKVSHTQLQLEPLGITTYTDQRGQFNILLAGPQLASVDGVFTVRLDGYKPVQAQIAKGEDWLIMVTPAGWVDCLKCADENPPENAFCRKCGHRLADDPYRTPSPSAEEYKCPKCNHSYAAYARPNFCYQCGELLAKER